MPEWIIQINDILTRLNLISTAFRILLAMVCGGVIGLEREKANQAAGMRTYMLVCMGASVAMLTGQYMYETFQAGDPARLGAQVISGIGFLGAGSIIIAGGKRVKGLTTAAGLWVAGCIGLAIASQVPGARVVLGELDEGALRICRQNIRRNSLSGQVVSLKMDALSDPPPRLGDFDCLVCNPPYIPSGDIAGLDVSVRDYEPHLALDGGTDGLDFYRSVCRRWRDVLHTGSRLAFEVGIGQADDVLRLMRGEGFGELEILPDPAGIPRVVTGLRYQEVYADA